MYLIKIIFFCVCRRINCGGHANPVNFSILATSLRLILQWSVPAVQARVSYLTNYLVELVVQKGEKLGLSILPSPLRCGHLVGIKVDWEVAKITMTELARGLKEAGIILSLRHASFIRVSPYVQNSRADMARLFETLERLITVAQVSAAERPKKVFLLIGGSGWLGQQLVHAFKNQSQVHESKNGEELQHYLSDTHELHVTYCTSPQYFLPKKQCHKLDLSNHADCQALIKALQPNIIVNTAAMSSPMACVKNQSQASVINCPGALFDAVRMHVPHALVLFTSTDLVYDGESAPNTPTAVRHMPPVPECNVYGSTKLNGERATCALPHGLVFRLSNMVGGNFIYSAPRNGGMKFLSWIQQSLEKRSLVSLKNDEIRSFVLSSDVTHLLLSVCWQYVSGKLPDSHPCWTQRVYNAGGPHGLSRLDLARIVGAAQGVTLRVHDNVDTGSAYISAIQKSRESWHVVSMSSLQMAAGDDDLVSMPKERKAALQSNLPPRDVTMDSSLTTDHFNFAFSSIESDIGDCLKKI